MDDAGYFHEALSRGVVAQEEEGNLVIVPCLDVASQYSLADSFASAANDLISGTAVATRRDSSSSQGSAAMQRMACYRAERDLWSLLSILLRADLLRDIEAEGPLEDQLLDLISPYASIKHVVPQAYGASASLRKGRVLKEWSEQAAADRVVECAPPSGFPHRATLSKLIKGRSTEVKSLHPDAQVNPPTLPLFNRPYTTIIYSSSPKPGRCYSSSLRTVSSRNLC